MSRYLKHLFILLAVKLPLQIIGLPILAVTLLFVPKHKETLPRFLRWFDNHELHLRPNGDDGLSGPPKERARYKDPTAWWPRFRWLALRNPVNYFQYSVLGFTVQMPCEATTESPNVGTHRWNDRGVKRNWLRNRDGKEYWEYYAVIPLYKNWHFRARIGWKIDDKAELYDGLPVQWVFAITPLKRLDDKE